MFGRISYTWSIMGASWKVLKEDKTMVIYPLLSGISCILVTASFIVPFIFSGALDHIRQDRQAIREVGYYVLLFAFYFANYLVITFFNTALVSCALKRLTGGQPTFKDGIAEAFSRIHLIVGWALLSATIGMVLKLIQERSGKLGQFISGLLGVAWGLISYLAVPVLVAQNKGPIAAAKESAALLKKTWGEQLIGNSSFGVIFFLLDLPAIAALVFGVILFAQQPAAGIALAVLAILWILALALVQATLQAIFQSAVYLYATESGTLERRGFPVDLVANCIRQK